MTATTKVKAKDDKGPDDWKNDMTITVEEFAKIVNIGKVAAYECVRRGDVDSIRLGNSIRVCVQPLLRKLEGRTAA
jgi:hypothetical protein